jgi:Arc/MetJ-type ribon-helix-helix transcriptional regulator
MATITFRTDPPTDAALDELTPPDENVDRSTVIRKAILVAARELRRQRLREEALRIAADPADRAEVAAIQEEMDAIRAW